MTIAGRIEARITVPSGVAVSATNSGGGATSVSLTAADYFWTAAGSLSGLAAHFQSQLNSSRAPSSGAWTVTIDNGATGTGRMAIGCSGTTAIPSFSLAWTSTALRDACGFTRDIDYPHTAAQMAADLGYGTWSAGYLFNEASGNAASCFGTPATLTATNSPTYSNQGPRGGSDKAIGFANTSYFDGGNVFDVTGTDDLCVAWVGKLTGAAASSSTLFSKAAASFANGWAVATSDGTNYKITGGPGGASNSGTIDASSLYNEWHVGIACVDRVTGKMRIGMRGLTSGTSVVSTEGTASGSFSTTANLRVGASAWTSQAATTFTCAYFAIGSGASAAAGFSANLSTALSNFAATFGTWTGTKQARFLWRPECPLIADQHTAMAPLVTDLRTTRGPTGVVYGLTGNSCYEHTNLTWSYVPKENVREAIATYANASWEQFYKDTQVGQGHTWGGVSLPVQIYDNAGTLLGSDLNSGAGADGWCITGVDKIKPERSVQDWDERWKLVIPSLVSSG